MFLDFIKHGERKFVFLVLLAGTFVFSGFAQEAEEWYQGKPIQNVVFTGLSHVRESELNGVMEPYIGLLFNDEIFWEMQGKLYALEYFEVISPSAVPGDRNGVVIRFDVTERPMISRINFVGNRGVRRSELLDTVSLKVNDVVNQAKLRMDETALINKYIEKGFPDVKVRSETQTANDSSIIVSFFIDEGEKIIITRIDFEGNAVFSARTLRGQVSLKPKNLINDGAFQEAKLLADRASVVQYYHDRGYIDADVTDVQQNVQKDAKGNNNLTITFRIYEGRIYTFGGITFDGNKIFPTEQLMNLITSKTGDTVNSRRLEADLQRVADLYYENGYIFNTIGREERRNTERGVVSYHIPIVERGRAHIENIMVRGNEKTRTEVILREMPLEPGDVFSKTKVMDGMRNLYNLQFFSAITPDTPPGSADSLMDLIINVEEQPTTDVQFGLTFSGTSDPDSFPVSGMLKWNDRNFRGTGNSLGAGLNASPYDQNIELNYTHRWILGLPLSGGFDFTAQHASRYAAMNNAAPFFYGDEEYAFPDGFQSYEEYVSSSKLPADEYLMRYEQWSFSLGFSTGYRWGTLLGNLSVGGGIRTGLVLNTYDAGLYRPFDPILREDNNRLSPSNSVWTSLSLDQRDIYYDPSKGYYGIQRVGLYGILPFEREHYLKTDTKAEWFFTLLDIPIVPDKFNLKTILGLHTGLSFIFNQPGRTGPVPIEKANMLAIDGMFIGRGWSSEYNNKGLALWENWAELRFPIVPNMLAWDFFFDAAALKPTPDSLFTNFALSDMRFSFGGGLRFSIPQFPFRFSFGKRFKIEDGNVTWVKGDIPLGEGGIDFIVSFAISTY
jgi:outer membrane protein insertion porin family